MYQHSISPRYHCKLSPDSFLFSGTRMTVALGRKLKIQTMMNHAEVLSRNTNNYMVFNEIVVCVPYLVSEGITGSQSRGPRRRK